jgi:hypothetical protein
LQESCIKEARFFAAVDGAPFFICQLNDKKLAEKRKKIGSFFQQNYWNC